MNPSAITVEELSKAYRIGAREEVPDTFTAAITGTFRYPFRNLRRLNQLSNLRDGDEGDDVLWAIKDVSFKVNEGEVVGIIGRNGAGKSTLLKILSRITEPTSGRAVIRGRVSSLLEVGTGFHPELTGRENIYMNGTILGMTKREIDRKFDEIVDFSGVEKFLDTPTKRYSSGMQVRLAFAVAAHLEPEILIIDEVLAVGDAEFQKKCLGKMEDVASSGRTVLFVSHNMAAVENLCNRAVVLQDGAVRYEGITNVAISEYLRHTSENHRIASDIPRDVGQTPLLQDVYLMNKAGERTSQVCVGETVILAAAYKYPRPTTDVSLGFTVENELGVKLFLAQSRQQHGIVDLNEPQGVAHCRITFLPLPQGKYYLSVKCGAKGLYVDQLERVVSFSVEESDVFGTGRMPSRAKGLFVVPAKWDWGRDDESDFPDYGSCRS